jgi:pyrroline-5-carboxylate reductase
MRKSLGFIGGGRITRILLQGFRNRNVKFKKIIVTDVNSDALGKLRADFPFIEAETASVAAAQDIVFLSLHPNVIMDTLALIRDDFKKDAVVVSLAPNINFAKIALRLQKVNKFARALPSATAYINEGYTPVAFTPDFPDSDKKDVLEIFGHLGKSFEVYEEKLEGFAIMSAMLPTYFWFQWKELVDIGQEIGLTEEESIDSINESVTASLHLMYKSGLPSDQVMDLIPVKPIGEQEEEIRNIYRSRLIDLYRKIKPEVLEGSAVSRH